MDHPKGLRLLCFTEALERFSYYTMSGLLALFLAGEPARGGLGWTGTEAAAFFGSYAGIVWFTPLFGGWVADRWTGIRGAMLLGAWLLTAGQALMCLPALLGPALGLPFFYGGLVLLALGNGLFKPNVTVMLGLLYGKHHPLREQGFTLFYVAINIGAVLSALVAGTIAEYFGWAWGFGVAALAMLTGVAALLVQPAAFLQRAVDGVQAVAPGLPRDPRRPLLFVVALVCFATLFWAAFLQTYGMLALFAYRTVDRSLLDWTIPVTWFGSLTAAYIILVGAPFTRALTRLKVAVPDFDIAMRFAIGLGIAAIGFVVLGFAATLAAPSFVWLLGFYLLLTLAELSISPAGNETVSRYAPAGSSGRLMAVWMLSLAFGSLLSGVIGGSSDPSHPAESLFALAVALAFAAALLVIVRPRLMRLVSAPDIGHLEG